MIIRKVLAAVAVGATATCGLLATDGIAAASGVNLTQQQADAQLSTAGIGRLSSGDCTYRGNSHCTSYDGINAGTVSGVVTLRLASGCPLVISGGTEVGHAAGAMSHAAGYKVDVSHNACIDSYVRSVFTGRPPTFGSEQYVSSRGNVYTDEGNHWDILFV